MAVHAHPDDETITMGGVLAVYADRGIETSVVCCTDGKLATIVDPSMPEETTRPRLTEIRRDELRQACSILGVREVHFLDYGDSGMAGEPSNQAPDAFWKADIEEATGRLVTHIRRFRPHVVVTYDANGGYGHPDHIQTHRITLLAVEAAYLSTLYPDSGPPWQVSKLYYTAFPFRAARAAMELAAAANLDPPFGDRAVEDLPFLTPDELATTEVECRDGVVRMREALRAHRSQIGPDWPLLALSDEHIVENFSKQYFQLAISHNRHGDGETDLFSGIEEEGSP
ncbi:MAG TPA: N-acetyl-1-D-myo-inositol-2-amino-2-deoxy-alpha-D-glucopyranoside deacetylase [Candidatus Sulfotelmatobacter sp.]|nr:N-acetyl-1-D-myo-inositol-2-amino-2-deoxy-alpha-D-glucopyranoside deacetylase [Candidatus Sulfotelmatobacter sp.]